MRFTTHDSAADAAALRAARGVHDIVLEEGDCAPALGALAPYLALWTEGDEYKISFGAAADISLRYMRLTDPAAVLLKFHQRQCSASPLSRSWQLIAAGLGLATLSLSAIQPLSRRAFRARVDAVVADLPATDKEQLQLVATDFMDRVAPASLGSAPFNTHGSWLAELTWGNLAPDGNMHGSWTCGSASRRTSAAGPSRTYPTCYLTKF